MHWFGDVLIHVVRINMYVVLLRIKKMSSILSVAIYDYYNKTFCTNLIFFPINLFENNFCRPVGLACERESRAILYLVNF